jgi:uncharacterized membrane protein
MLRSCRERIFQTLMFEAGGLLVAIPLYEAAFGRNAQDSALLISLITVAVLIWTPLHNAIFDTIEHSLTARPASARPHPLRLLHAITHEVTPIAVTLPLIMLVGRHTLAEALAVNAGLTVLYVAYAYLFYWLYDRVRPLQALAGVQV